VDAPRRLDLALALVGLAAGCSSPPDAEAVAAYQAAEIEAIGDPPLDDLEQELARIDLLRAEELDLEGSRRRCLAVVSRHPDAPEVLWRAARAEADAVIALRAAGSEREPRDLAALSSLDYARAARDAAEAPDARSLGQLAWSLGAATHLQPMFDRDDHAAATLAVAEAALARDPDETAALATVATLHVRLLTLPWIADLFAGDAPEADPKAAVRHAERAYGLVPSLEHALVLAKALRVDEQPRTALGVLDEALEVAGARPRDHELEGEARALRDALREE